ncbi:DUF3467 domain-containing protein [Halosquirtibacter xylanolyticus]|uniref:DUF3467 domain-containing protein n=1 Tax=Halosquirtibacter xylanolyticus TaxID=3374599 RepID=UPI0037498F57|nr:DUF3467 domain-containing protein [Prolixibacteraceae bacterium]
MNREENQSISIELPEEVAEGTYSNLAVISHSSSEFVMDFIRMMPGVDKAKVKSRVVMCPEHAKRLLLTLEENVRRYESMHGSIKLHDGEPSMPPPMNFSGPAGEA